MVHIRAGFLVSGCVVGIANAAPENGAEFYPEIADMM
ncbi:MAG: hypothetical protein ACJAZA_002118 [Shewanella psychromarinicola]|jgi:hypothetical protein